MVPMITRAPPTLRRPHLQQDNAFSFPVDVDGKAVLIVVATYNEMDNVPDLVADILAVLPAVHILVVDDHSPDGTGRWCEEHATQYPQLHCIHRSGKLGLGTAIVTGLKYAIDHGYDYVINMDADYSHHPAYLPLLVANMNHHGLPRYDVLIGSRYIHGGSIRGWPLLRHLMSRGVNLYTRWLLCLTPRDCSGGYRCYRTSILGHMPWDMIRSVGYAFQEEFLWHLHSTGANIGEFPIVFVNRSQGQSKIDLRESLSALTIIGRLGVRTWLRI